MLRVRGKKWWSRDGAVSGSDGERGWTGVNQDRVDCDKLMFGDVVTDRAG